MKKDIICDICGKRFSNKGIGTHIWRQHGKGKNHSVGEPWNKGLTKENNEIIAARSEKIKGNTNYKHWKNGPGFKGKKHTRESREKISKALSVNNKGGRCKWYDVSGQKVQGTWERDIATKLDELHIKWTKLKTNKDTLRYELDKKLRSYTPDFYLEEYNLFLEIKGFWWGNDKNKMQAVMDQHPEKNIKIIEKLEYKKIMDGELVW